MIWHGLGKAIRRIGRRVSGGRVAEHKEAPHVQHALADMRHGLILVGAARSPHTGHWVAGPLETLTALSIPCYALVGLLALMFWAVPPATAAARRPA